MFTKLLNLFKPKPPAPHWTEVPVAVPLMPAVAAPAEKVVSEKDKATALNEPYVSIISVEVDPNNINNGAFEFDWNDKFLLNLIKAGYKTKQEDTDAVIVDRWFQQVCRNVVLEMYEQTQADPENRDPNLDTRIINHKPLGSGRAEIS